MPARLAMSLAGAYIPTRPLSLDEADCGPIRWDGNRQRLVYQWLAAGRRPGSAGLPMRMYRWLASADAGSAGGEPDQRFDARDQGAECQGDADRDAGDPRQP